MKKTKICFNKMNEWYERKIPFFFLSDFLGEKVEVVPLAELHQQNIFCSNPLFVNVPPNTLLKKDHLQWKRFPIPFEDYCVQFEKIKAEIRNGNTYLLNLTCETKIETNYTLKELFSKANSKYKLSYKDEFIHFSPEPFITISGDTISSFPMKGTIDADLGDSAKQILENKKELAEQFIIVDLIRNDLSMIAKDVCVDDFRYTERINTNKKNLLSVSSKISGKLKDDYKSRPGDIFAALLPAGSVCGAPKAKTIEIILKTETHERGWYTGIWGIFDGRQIDSCIIIRYLEKKNNELFFKSGGGITSMSDVHTEYQEMIDKIYVPVY